jgi:hypothetical protein
MKLEAAWVTPRHYSGDFESDDLIARVTGTHHEADTRRLIAVMEAGRALDGHELERLCDIIAEHAASLLPEDDAHWESTGEIEVTHVHRGTASG